MREKMEEYYFRAVHKRTEESVCHSFEYTKVFKVIPIEAYENLIYKIEISEAKVSFDKKYKKMEDIYRRLQYIYSGIIVRLNNDRQVISVENTTELQQNWAKRKMYILKDYTGSSITHYTDSITAKFSNESFFRTLFCQYKDFGLLFPNVPPTHAGTYTGERIMTVNNVETLSMLEKTDFERTEDRIRHYSLSAVTTQKSEFPIHSYKGSIFFASDRPLLKKAVLNISYGCKWTNEWNFHLSRIE